MGQYGSLCSRAWRICVIALAAATLSWCPSEQRRASESSVGLPEARKEGDSHGLRAKCNARTAHAQQRAVSCLRQAVGPELQPVVNESCPSAGRQQWSEYVATVHEALAPARNLRMHSYAGYSGPWIENHAISYFEPRLLDFYPLVPLLAQWTDLLVEERHNTAARAAVDELLSHLDDRYIHFAVTQHDRGDVACLNSLALYRNVLLFSGGGWGDVSVPLLKAPVSPHTRSPTRKYIFSFVGRFNEHRKRLLAGVISHPLANEPGFVHVTTTPQWQDVASQSLFCLSPRGYGRTAFRLAELIQSGCVPLHIADDVVWVPYNGDDLLQGLSGPMWSPQGIGFAIKDTKLGRLVCMLCTLLDRDSPVLTGSSLQSYLDGDDRPCYCDEKAWRGILTQVQDSGVQVSKDSVLGHMETRMSAIAQAYFSADRVMERIGTMLTGPDHSSGLACTGKPETPGNVHGTGEPTVDRC